MMLYAPEDYYDPESGDLLVRKGICFVLILFVVGSDPIVQSIYT